MYYTTTCVTIQHQFYMRIYYTKICVTVQYFDTPMYYTTTCMTIQHFDMWIFYTTTCVTSLYFDLWMYYTKINRYYSLFWCVNVLQNEVRDYSVFLTFEYSIRTTTCEAIRYFDTRMCYTIICVTIRHFDALIYLTTVLSWLCMTIQQRAIQCINFIFSNLSFYQFLNIFCIKSIHLR